MTFTVTPLITDDDDDEDDDEAGPELPASMIPMQVFTNGTSYDSTLDQALGIISQWEANNATKAERREYIAKQSQRIWARHRREDFARRSERRVNHIVSLVHDLAAAELAKRDRAEAAKTIAKATEVFRKAAITRNDARTAVRTAKAALKSETKAVTDIAKQVRSLKDEVETIKERAAIVVGALESDAIAKASRTQRVETDWAEKASSIVDPDLANAYAELVNSDE